MIECINARFEQEGFKTYQKLEDLILLASKGQPFEEQFDQIEQMYGETDFDCFALKTQLTTVKTLFTDNTDIYLQDIVNKFKTLSQGQLMFYSEVSKLMKLILILPATNCESERAFSALKRLKLI